MRVLMISIDRTLLGSVNYWGDALERHQEYAERVGRLEIIVLAGKTDFSRKKISDHLAVYPTNSASKLTYVFDAFEIAKNIYWPDKFDLVVVQDPFLCGLSGWLVKWRFKIPLLVHFHGDFWQNKYWLLEKGRWWFNWFFLLISKFVVRRADGLRAVSSGIEEKLLRAGLSKGKIRVIPTPVDVEKFGNFDLAKVEAFRKAHGARKVIINVGRKDPAKDFKTLGKAVRLVYEDFKNLAFWQIGADLYWPEKIRADQNLMITFTGRIEQNELANYYHAADVYVSSSRHESFGKVLIEAMACGLPVVATATTGSKAIIQDGVNGFLVPVGDSAALARKILYLLNNPDKAKEMGEQGRAMARKKFSQAKTVDQIVDFWQDLITKSAL